MKERKNRNWKIRKGTWMILACLLTALLAAGCGSKTGSGAGKKEEAVTETAAQEGASGGGTDREAQDQAPPATGSMAETETDALGNPINDDGVYYDEDGNLVSEEDMILDEDGNPLSEEDLLYAEGGDDDWSSVEYGDREAFVKDIKTGYEEVTSLPFEVTGEPLYMLYANGVYEIQYENDTNLVTFRKGKGVEDLSGITVAFDKEETLKAGDIEATVYSYAGKAIMANWDKGEFSYSIYIDPGCTQAEMTEMIASVKGNS